MPDWTFKCQIVCVSLKDVKPKSAFLPKTRETEKENTWINTWGKVIQNNLAECYNFKEQHQFLPE